MILNKWYNVRNNHLFGIFEWHRGDVSETNKNTHTIIVCMIVKIRMKNTYVVIDFQQLESIYRQRSKGYEISEMF